MLNELTYPMVTQSILTNGRDWVFSTYQANTIAVWKRDLDNPYRKPHVDHRRPQRPVRAHRAGLRGGLERGSAAQHCPAVPEGPMKDHSLNLRPYIAQSNTSYWAKDAVTGPGLNTPRVPFYHREKPLNDKPRDPYKPEI